MEPAKAARIMAPEPMDTDLLKRKIIRKGLKQKSGNGKCSAEDDNRKNPRKTDLPDNIIRNLISLMPEYDIQDLLHREVDTSGIYIPYK